MVTQRISYKIKNWKEYNKSLVDRGSITLWLSDDIALSKVLEVHPMWLLFGDKIPNEYK